MLDSIPATSLVYNFSETSPSCMQLKSYYTIKRFPAVRIQRKLGILRAFCSDASLVLPQNPECRPPYT